MSDTMRRAAAALCIWLALAGLAASAPARHLAAASRVWVGAWASSQQIPEPRNALDPADLHDATLRQIVRLSIGGSRLRVRVSNAFGTAPLAIGAVHIARALAPGSARIDATSDRGLTFSGRADIIVPAGADYFSDPIDYPTMAFSDIAITLYLPDAPAQQTGHPGSRTTSFYTHGNLVAAPDLADAKTIDHWYQLSGIDVTAPRGARAVVILGDSITDGRGSTTNGNDRWPDLLMRRLQAAPATRHVAVLNAGTGGNRLLLDGLGPSALARFDRDVIAQTGVKYAIMLEGVNDLGTLMQEGAASADDYAALVARVTGAYRQLALRAHAHGLRLYGATILPGGGMTTYVWTAQTEGARNAINHWIRTSGTFDAVIDFDAIMRDPAQPDRLRPDYDSGDHLHPSPAGYRAMAAAAPLSLFTH